MPKGQHKTDTRTLDNINKQNISLLRCKMRLTNNLEKKNGQPLSTVNIRYIQNEPLYDKYFNKREQQNQLTTI